MARIVTVGAAQLGPIARSETRAQVVQRLLELMRQAKAHGCELVVFPELALTRSMAISCRCWACASLPSS